MNAAKAARSVAIAVRFFYFVRPVPWARWMLPHAFIVTIPQPFGFKGSVSCFTLNWLGVQVEIQHARTADR